MTLADDRVPPVVAFLVVFVAEWADLTQIATAALVAMTGQHLSVAIGAIGALWLANVLVSVAGSRLGSALTPTDLNPTAGRVLDAAEQVRGHAPTRATSRPIHRMARYRRRVGERVASALTSATADPCCSSPFWASCRGDTASEVDGTGGSHR